METIYKTNECKMTLLKEVDIGTLGYLEYDVDVNRLGFLVSVTALIITPLLHSNEIKFMGLRNENEYATFKVIKDKFIGLSYQGGL